MPQVVQDANELSAAYDRIEQEVDDTGEVTGQFANVAGEHAGGVLDPPPAAGENQAAKQQPKQRVNIDSRLEHLSGPRIAL